MQVTVYTTNNCVQCMMTKKELTKLGVRFDEISLELHPDKLEEFKAKGLLSAPIVTTDTKVWSGFQPTKIRSLADHLAKPVELTEAQKERKRIIKLLEDSRKPCDCGDSCGQWDAGFDEAIALIKADNE
jgi:glutaredoxin-like protein NrdH